MDRMLSKSPRGEDEAAHHATFEETYRRYEFAELVRLAVAAGAWLAKLRHRAERRRPDVPTRPLPGGMNPAE